MFSNTHLTRFLANAVLRMISESEGYRIGTGVTGEILEIDHGFCGSGYGQATPEGLEAAQMLEGEEGITLDTTYTAKAMACLISRARQGWARGEDVLFWYTLNSVPLEVTREALS
jgi:1-aminocyclopropane-1-carboxylate deaminase/D-cysteine desulfhydrase-like pyridoxal-dependent ACC family enzyme